MTPTRPCRYCLSLQDGSGFADFDVDTNDQLFLVRISFDGFGCCRISDSTRTMSIEDSTRLIRWLESDDLSNDAVTAILTQYFEANSDIIWRDALVTHGLLESDTDHDPKG